MSNKIVQDQQFLQEASRLHFQSSGGRRRMKGEKFDLKAMLKEIQTETGPASSKEQAPMNQNEINRLIHERSQNPGSQSRKNQD
jgi:hypothetical protein